MRTIAAMQTSAHFAPLVAFGAAARQFGARSPSGALLRHSPGRTHPPLAQLQFPRFLRPDLTGVTRFDLSQVYRAPGDRSSCRSSGGPEPPGSGWHIRPQAPPPLRFSGMPSGKAPSMSEVVTYVTEMGTIVKSRVSDVETAAKDWHRLKSRVESKMWQVRQPLLFTAVHRRVRHARSERGEGATRRVVGPETIAKRGRS